MSEEGLPSLLSDKRLETLGRARTISNLLSSHKIPDSAEPKDSGQYGK